jgi:hypothetical protein
LRWQSNRQIKNSLPGSLQSYETFNSPPLLLGADAFSLIPLFMLA